MLDDPFGYERYGKEQPGRELWQTVLGGNAGSMDFAGDRVITVIDSRQAGLQGMITKLMAGFKSKPDAYLHLGYESVTLSPETARTLGLETGGKRAQMSGRRGLYVSADSVYLMLKERVRKETLSRNPGMGGGAADSIAHGVAVATLRYEMVKQDLDKIITFDLAKSLSLEGDTAPYLQYAYARAARIIERAGRVPGVADCSLLSGAAEIGLVRHIGMLDTAVTDAARNLSPKVMARYCHGLAVAFNVFYEKSKVLGLDDPALERARLYLVSSFVAAMGEGLGLLGMAAPDRM